MKKEMIDLGFIQIRWYSIFILLAVLIATYLISKEAKKKGLEKDPLLDLIFYCVLIGILGARTYYVLFNLEYYLQNPQEIIAIWHGGLAIHGAILSSFLFLIFYTRKKKINLLLLLDIIVVGLIIAQAIGRWGNFFNGEAFGRVVTKEFLENIHLPNFIIKGMYIDGFYREPTFLYESISSFICFLVLVLVRKIKKLKTGTLSSIYLIWYGTTRLIIEGLRTDSLMLGPIRIAQLVSIISIIIGIILWIKSNKNTYYIEDKFTKIN